MYKYGFNKGIKGNLSNNTPDLFMKIFIALAAHGKTFSGTTYSHPWPFVSASGDSTSLYKFTWGLIIIWNRIKDKLSYQVDISTITLMYIPPE